MATDDYFKVRGKTFYNAPFYNCVLSTNIAVYKYLADTFFSGDMDRVVWSSTDKMFKNRQTQLAKRKTYNGTENNLEILDFPFCSFRLTQDGIKGGVNRPWFNHSLTVEGMWIEELQERLTLTPMTLNYEACFCCNHDSDLYQAQQAQIYDDAAAETILESYLETTDANEKPVTLKNIIIYDNDAHVNSSFTEGDWKEKNKIQTITIDITCQTWLVQEDKNHHYSVSKKVLFDFANGVGLNNKLHIEGDVDKETEKVIGDLFFDVSSDGKVDVR